MGIVNRKKKRQRGGATQAERASKQEESIQPNTLLCHNSVLNIQCRAFVRLCNLSGINLMTALVRITGRQSVLQEEDEF